MTQPPRAPIEIEYNSSGYLLMPAAVARLYFPRDVLELNVKGGELWMSPTGAPGLLLKQRNAAGDRSLLVSPHVPDDVTAGRWPGRWDDGAGALRVAYRSPLSGPPPPLPKAERAIAAKAIVENEEGRWVVYLDLGFSSASSSGIRIERRRIADYSCQQRARVAANWIERSADRDLRRPLADL